MPLTISRALKKNIFISYQSKDYGFAKDIEECIKDRKYNHDLFSGKLSVTLLKTDDFFDKTSLLFEKIKKIIYKSDCVVVIINEKFSDWVLSEITIARVFNKPIIIVVTSNKIDFSKSICEGYPVLYKDKNYDLKERLNIFIQNVIENKKKKNNWVFIWLMYVIYSMYQISLFHDDILLIYFVLFKAVVLLLTLMGIEIFMKNIYFGHWKNGDYFRELTLDENVMRYSSNAGKHPNPDFHKKNKRNFGYAMLACFFLISFKGFLFDYGKGVMGIMGIESINLIALYIPILSVVLSNRMIK